jgi:DNA-binding transcriptional ArsR family regulator
MAETLHFYLRDHGPVLANRRRGREVADTLRDLSDDRGDVILDFDDVDVVTPPFVQELLDAVLSVIRNDGRLVVTANMNEDVAETLAMVLERRKATLAYNSGNQVQLLNELAPHLGELLREAQRLRRPFTVTELAEKIGVPPNTLHGRLKPLLESGAAARERDAEAPRGVRHRYRVVSGREPALETSNA